jgi:hypothetical protein
MSHTSRWIACDLKVYEALRYELKA